MGTGSIAQINEVCTKLPSQEADQSNKRKQSVNLRGSLSPKGQTEQEAQLMLTNPRDAFRGQSRSPNMVPFDMLGMVSH